MNIAQINEMQSRIKESISTLPQKEKEYVKKSVQLLSYYARRAIDYSDSLQKILKDIRRIDG